MTIAIVLVLILLLSIAFHFSGPWVLPELASNWSDIDLTIGITLVVTGLVFIAVILFTAYAVFRFRYRADRTADYEPENKKLELWLTGLTTVGIVAMLAPGLAVYSDIVTVPDDAMEIEVLAKQWSWAFRYAGEDGELGRSDINLINQTNPFGLDPKDPAAQDDRLVNANEFRLPLDQPVNVNLRSIDVLHDFYIPQIRNKMDAVPGIVSSLWFTPTKIGRFEILCAEYCGVGHYNMRGALYVANTEAFTDWLEQQPTFAASQAASNDSALSPAAQRGEILSVEQGCLACHGFDTSPLGPSWLGLYGRTEEMDDGSEVLVDDVYLAVAIREPAAQIVDGYGNVMPPYELSDEQISEIIAYIKEAGGISPALSSQWDEPEPPPQAELEPAPTPSPGPAAPLDGATLASAKGCRACHSTAQQTMIGPAWGGLAGSTRTLEGGGSVIANRHYLRRAIVAPAEQVVAGYPPVMPAVPLTDEEIEALVQYLIDLGEQP
ncbi:c-type cytochrome [Ferrimonas pelagia]|uniref:cytochrome-c oxidase n=1 Tax=Ferrimonas pelagia TaxID=1177826 RepID=A0ABP9FEQ8_9GAMM